MQPVAFSGNGFGVKLGGWVMFEQIAPTAGLEALEVAEAFFAGNG